MKSFAVLALVVYTASAAVNYPTFDYHGEPPVVENRWVADTVRDPVVQVLAVAAAAAFKTVPIITMEVHL